MPLTDSEELFPEVVYGPIEQHEAQSLGASDAIVSTREETRRAVKNRDRALVVLLHGSGIYDA